MLHPVKVVAGIALLGLIIAACAPGAAPPPAPAPPAGQPAAQQPAAPPNPVDAVEITRPVEVLFWHRQTGQSEALQNKLIAEFNAANPNIKVKAESLGDYTKLYQKVLASIQAGSPPDLAAAYESMSSDYYEAKAIVPFDDYISSKKYGLSAEELKDFVPSFLEGTKFPQYDGKHLTFPYTKSSLTWYANLEVLRPLGFNKLAATWDELLTHCRAAVAAGKQCWAFDVDASLIDAMMFSFGAEVVSKDGKKPTFDSPEAMKVLKFIETLAKEKLIYRFKSRDDLNDVAAGRTVYMMRSSTNVPFLGDALKDNSKWAAGLIPQGTPDKKATTLFGANVSMFKSTPEKQLASWLFVKWFTTKEVTARWGLDKSNGYFPVRLSALAEPSAKKYLEENPHFAAALDASKYGKVEPSVKGWQEMRPVLQDAVEGIVIGKLTAEQASAEIQQKGTKVLAQQ